MLRQHVGSHHFRFDDGRQARVFRSPHPHVWPTELDHMAQLAGRERESRNTDSHGAPFTAELRSRATVYRPPHDD